MHVQAPSSTTLSRAPQHALLAAFAALAIAGGTVGVIAITDDNGGGTVQRPVVSQAATDRVLDGSPILRGTASAGDARLHAYRHAMAPTSLRTSVAADSRVLDGSPILRGHVVTHVSSVQGTPRPLGRPMGFGYVP